MRFFMLTSFQNMEESKFLIDCLNVKGHEVCLFQQHDEFKKQIKENPVPPDFLLVDYDYYNHVRYNLYRELSSMSCTAPAIFYNDPQMKKTSSIQNYWYSLILEYYYSPLDQLMEYKKILMDLDYAVGKWQEVVDKRQEQKDLMRYFEYFMKGIKPEAKQEVGEDEKNRLILSELKAAPYLICKKLIENANKEVSTENLLILIQKPGKKPSIATLSCAISTIRKTLKNAKNSDIRIIKTVNGYTLVKN